MARDLRKIRLPNGVRVITEATSEAASCSLGVWLDVGSRDERPGNNGVAHLFEHMVFKGSRRRTALDIVRSLEAKGGHLNAFTTKEQTCFYANVVADEVPLALDVLLDMVFWPTLDAGELAKEKEVVVEELKSSDDTPEERVYDLFGKALFGSHSMGFPIAGTIGSVRSLQRRHLLGHLGRVRRRLPVFVVASGRLDHGKIAEWTRRATQGKSARSGNNGSLERRSRLLRANVRFRPSHLVERREAQQASVLLGGPGFPVDDPRRFSASLLNCILGDGMSSRLFQKVREEYGYVYNISSFTEGLTGAGVLGISFGTDPDNLAKTLRLINGELVRLKREGVTSRELEFAKEYVRGGFQLEMESNQSRMAFLARLSLHGHKFRTPEEYLKMVDRVTLYQLNKNIKQLLDSRNWASAAVVPHGTRLHAQRHLDF